MTPREAKLQARAELAEAKLARMREVLQECLWLTHCASTGRLPSDEIAVRWEAMKVNASASLDESKVDE